MAFSATACFLSSLAASTACAAATLSPGVAALRFFSSAFSSALAAASVSLSPPDRVRMFLRFLPDLRIFSCSASSRFCPFSSVSCGVGGGGRG